MLMKKSAGRTISVTMILTVTLLIIWDFTEASKTSIAEGVFCPEKNFSAITGATTKVAVVPSNYETLANPTPTDDDNITYETVEEMIREALTLQGGLDWLIRPGDRVLIKPNIVDPEPPGSGEVTDVRVVKALIKIIHETANGDVVIIVGEGSPREMDYELPYSGRTAPQWERLWDKAGYQDLLTDPYLEGIEFHLVNLNGSPAEDPWQDLVLVEVPGGGVAAPHNGRYWIHKEILDADVFITVPVLKTHKANLTCALKNQIGIAPSTKYGFSKTGGVPQDGYAYKLIHRADLPRDWVHEEIVDLCTLADIDLVVVDALVTLESGKEAIRDGNGIITNQVRFNTIVAGVDPVAVDNVCARLIGLNPDDVDHLMLAEKVGLGTNDPDNIHLKGRDIAVLQKKLKKDPYFTSDFGRSNRTWLLNGPHDIAGLDYPISHEFIDDEINVKAEAEKENWSQAIYFFDNRIDLGSYYNGAKNVVAYAFSYFSAPQSQDAELWIGSDEAIRVYINHELVYDYTGTRSYGKERLVSDKIPVRIKAGENTLLIKTLQKYGEFDFALNICEPEPDIDLDGNRVMGLKFYTASTSAVPVELINFQAETEGKTIKLSWETDSETNNWRFEIERSRNHSRYQNVGSVPGQGTTSSLSNYSFVDRVDAPGEYSYRLKQIDLNGQFTYSEVIEATVAQPHKYTLFHNYPNPFNQGTTLSFDLPETAEVKLRVFAVDGALVRTLYSAVAHPGQHRVLWDGRDEAGNPLASGIYFVRLTARGFAQTIKMNLVK